MENSVSIIMPAFNCEKFIDQSIESVINQSYQNWELLIVNDGSTDNTKDIVESYAKHDSRISLINFEDNQGAAISRNVAVDQAKNRFLAFLDSDDVWKPEKLEKQLKFMRINNCTFSCTYYGKIDEMNNEIKKIIRSKDISDYGEVLKNCPGNSTVIYDSVLLGKFYIDNIKKRNDFVMWLKVIKKAEFLYCLDEVLSYHRERSGSLSGNKISLLKYQWQVYRYIEKLSAGHSIKLILYKFLKIVSFWR